MSLCPTGTPIMYSLNDPGTKPGKAARIFLFLSAEQIRHP
jgi:hypothetical protein